MRSVFSRLSVCLSRGFTRLRCANLAERIEVLLGVEILGDLKMGVTEFDAAFAELLWPACYLSMKIHGLH